MDISVRRVLPEILDSIDPGDPRALRSRRDLRRVHRAMRTVSILTRAVDSLRLATTPRRILELGGGDGTLLLRLARLRPQWAPVSLTVLDMQDLVSTQTRAAYQSMGWEVQVMQTDALRWARDASATHFDLCLTNLFLHHFVEPALTDLMRAIARDCDAIVACEPRRNGFCLLGSRAIGLLGTNYITRHDAVTSVRAGFAGRELSTSWPAGLQAWSCREYGAFPFMHCFAAARHSAQVGAAR